MLSLSHLQPNIFRLFNLARKEGAQIKVSYNDKVFLLTIEPTREAVVRPKQKPHGKKKGIQIRTRDCPKCGGVEMNGICLAKVCKPNQQ